MTLIGAVTSLWTGLLGIILIVLMVDAKICSAFFTLVCINQVFSFAVDSRVDMMGVASNVWSDWCFWVLSVWTLTAGVATRGTAALPAAKST